MSFEIFSIVAQAIWIVAFLGFLFFAFYMHFLVRPFRHDTLFDRDDEHYGFNLKVLGFFVILLVSGFVLFA
ncbi:hypothetical protein [Roseovarius sp. E0-M6]|uniref:hypothetical protein n=1 Tax=Roseovarius sp. E0-M6 TaxID=3127118 RepID=UPI00300F8DE6